MYVWLAHRWKQLMGHWFGGVFVTNDDGVCQLHLLRLPAAAHAAACGLDAIEFGFVQLRLESESSTLV